MRQHAVPSVPVVTSVASLGGARTAWLVDLWGVIHNGVEPFAAASSACETFRSRGGRVVLLSNAPRPWDDVARQLDRLAVPRNAWDAIVTSGDATRAQLAESRYSRIFHLGPDRDLGLYTGLGVAEVASDAAQACVCTGLFDDETQSPDDYRELLAGFASRGIPMICANPDLRVERGTRLIPCAGAVAKLFEDLGGRVSYAGKPHLPIYGMAFTTIDRLAGRHVDKAQILAIGDGVATDILGAANAGIESLFIASGVHMPDGAPLSAALIDRLFPEAGGRPIAAMPALAWT